MSYKLFTDKQEIFECKIHLEGASLNNASSRIVVNTSDLNLMFEGDIDKDGNCSIPIKKLKGLLGENDKGKMKLEVIADDVYFMPWESDFSVDTSKKIKVDVKPQIKSAVVESKPKVVIEKVKNSKPISKKPKQKPIQKINPVDRMVEVLHKQGIGVTSIYESKDKMIPVLKQYSKKLGYQKGEKKFIKEVINKLVKKNV